MRNTMGKWFIVVLLLVVTSSSCGGGSSGTGGSGLNGSTSVSGTAYSPNGDPMPQVTVYVPGTTVSPTVSKATRAYGKVTAADGTVCEDPPSADQSLVSCCSGQNGTFTCDTSAITTNPEQIVFLRGSLRMVQSLSCSGGACALGTSTTTFGQGGGTTTWPKVAVVTGAWDRMEDVLAKLADTNTADGTNGQYGRVDADGTVTGAVGRFVYGSEKGTNLTIITGIPVSPYENTDTVTYTSWDKFLDGTNALVSGGSPLYDVVFINCGSGYDTAQYLTDGAKAILRAYVEAGGRLYVTDLSYDFVEQPFPQVMKFENDPDDITTPGDFGAAERGTSGVDVDAAVGATAMSTWLGTVGVNRHDASTPGNPDIDCSYGTAAYEQVSSALTAGGLIPTGDFLSNWAHMVEKHAGQSTTIWISSGSTVTFDGLVNRPLTVSMDSGSNGGRIIYSSYHTAHSCPSIKFWPQERVLQYLIFQAF